jgi:hypothetical protein
MLEPSTKNIDGLTIVISPLPARQGLRVLHRLGKSISPSVSRMIGLARGGMEIDLSELDVVSLSQALSNFFETCSEKDLDYFIDQLLDAAIVNNQRLLDVVNTVFQAKVLTLLKVLVFAVEVNYQDFFGGLRDQFAKQQAKKPASTSKTA